MLIETRKLATVRYSIMAGKSLTCTRLPHSDCRLGIGADQRRNVYEFTLTSSRKSYNWITGHLDTETIPGGFRLSISSLATIWQRAG